MLNKIKKELYLYKMELLFKKGLENGQIIPF